MTKLNLSSPLLLVVIALMGVGLVQVYSASYMLATENFGSGVYFVQRQAFFVVAGLIVLFTMAVFPMDWLKKLSPYLWVLSSLLVLATFIPGLGLKIGGAIRWLSLPFGFRLEPSELLKFSFALFFASQVDEEMKARRFDLRNRFVIFCAPLFLLLRQPDFGSFAIISTVAVTLLFAFGLKWRWVILTAASAIPTLYFLVMRVDYRRARVLSFLDPWSDPAQKGFQSIQSMLSFHAGGLTGVGLGQGQGKLFFLPEAHTDFTLAVFGEENGFIGFILLMVIYAFIIFRGFQIAIWAEDKFQKALALGISLTFGLSVFINSGVVLGLLPTKGLTLPFLSYGGSSLLALSFVFGILLNIESQQTSQKKVFSQTRTRR